MIHRQAFTLEQLQSLIPTDKSDVGRAEAAVKAGYPAVEPILGPLVEWLQDCNWPVAQILAPFLQKVGAPLVQHIWHVLRSEDNVWKYWVIGILIRSLPKEVAVRFRAELERLAYTPKPNERAAELDEVANDVLMHFGWSEGDA